MTAPEQNPAPPPKKISRSSLKGFLWSAAEVWGRQAGSFIVYVVIARLLTPSDFGVVAVARVFLELVSLFIRQGMADAIVQRSELRSDHLDTAFWLNFAIGVIGMILCILMAPYIEKLMAVDGAAIILIAMSPTMLITSINIVQDGLLRKQLKFKPLALRRIGGTIIGGIIGITMAAYGYGAWSLVGQVVIGGVAGAVLLWFGADWRPGFNITRLAFRDLYGFSLSIFASNIVFWASRRADTILISRFLGAATYSLYDLASRIMWFLVMALTSVSTRVSFSKFSKINTEPEKVREGFYEVTTWTGLLCFPCFAAVGILSPWIVPLVFGEQWMGSVPIMQIITWWGIPQSLTAYSTTVLRSMGASRLSLIVVCLGAVWNVIGFLLFMDGGIVAIAWVFLAGGLVTVPVSFYFAKGILDLSLRTYLAKLAPGALCLAGMAATLLLAVRYPGLKEPSLLSLVVLLVVAAVSYLAFMWMFARSEFRTMADLARRVYVAKTKKKKKSVVDL